MDLSVNATTGDMLLVPLKQLGATDIIDINSRLYYIKFKLKKNITVSYVYNINAKSKYFLQRISPYPLPKGLFTNQEEIIDIIKRDIRKFKTACNSSNFELFLGITNTLGYVSSDIESLFLNYNIPKEQLDQFYHQLHQLSDLVHQMKAKSTHIILRN